MAYQVSKSGMSQVPQGVKRLVYEADLLHLVVPPVQKATCVHGEVTWRYVKYLHDLSASVIQIWSRKQLLNGWWVLLVGRR